MGAFIGEAFKASEFQGASKKTAKVTRCSDGTLRIRRWVVPQLTILTDVPDSLCASAVSAPGPEKPCTPQSVLDSVRLASSIEMGISRTEGRKHILNLDPRFTPLFCPHRCKKLGSKVWPLAVATWDSGSISTPAERGQLGT